MKNKENGFSITTVIILIFVIGVVGFAGYSVLSNSSEDGSATIVSDEQISEEIEIAEQDINVGLNEEVKMSNGFTFKVASIEKGWSTKKDRSIPEPKSGTEYVAVNITITNNSNETIKTGGRYLTLTDEQSNEYAEVPSSYQLEENTALLKDVAPGESISGQIVYANVIQDNDLTYIYETAYINTSTGESVDLKASVRLY